MATRVRSFLSKVPAQSSTVAAAPRLLQPTAVGIALALVAAVYAISTRSLLAANIAFYLFLWSGTSTAWALHGGLAGRLSLGPAAYFGVGAYTVAILETRMGVLPIVGLVIAAALGAVLGALTEVLTGRLEGIYYALVTFALAQLLWLVAGSWQSVTGGGNGITISSSRSGLLQLSFNQGQGYVVVAGVFWIVTWLIYSLLKRSRWGYFVQALRDSEPSAKAAGISPMRWRALTAGISASLIAVAGVLLAQNLLFVDPDTFLSFSVITLIILPAILGGTEFPSGAILGGIVIVPLEEWLTVGNLKVSAAAAAVGYGLVLGIAVIFMPAGVLGAGRSARNAISRRVLRRPAP